MYTSARFASGGFRLSLLKVAFFTTLIVPIPATELTNCPAPAGLIAWWPAGGNANDVLGLHHGSVSGGVSFEEGIAGRAFSLDGSGEVTIPNAAAFSVQTFTIEAWVFPTALDGGEDVIVTKESLNFLPVSFQFAVRGQGFPGGTIPIGNLAYHIGGIGPLPNDHSLWVDGGGPVALNEWTHVALAFDGSTVRTYVNGVLAREVIGLSGSVNVSDGPIRVGSRSLPVIQSNPQERFNGRIDSLRMFGRALTSDELFASFASTKQQTCGILVVTSDDLPSEVAVDENVTFSVRVFNPGAGSVSDVRLTNSLPAGLRFSDASVTQGSWNRDGNMAIADFGTLAAGATATFTITVISEIVGVHTNAISVATSDAEVRPISSPLLKQITVVPVTISISDARNTEEAQVDFEISLSVATSKTISVQYATLSGTAVSGADFIGTNGMVTFAPSQILQTVRVFLISDLLDEDEETFGVRLSESRNASISDSDAMGTIADNDPSPALFINDVSIGEGDIGTTNVVFGVFLSSASGRVVGADFYTTNRTAQSGTDYQEIQGRVEFQPGETRQKGVVTVNGDTVEEGHEMFQLTFANLENVTAGDIMGTAVIRNDDGLSGRLHHFDWAVIPSPQYVQKSFPAALFAKDFSGATISNFTASVALTGFAGTAVPSSVVITEVAPGPTGAIELVNVSPESVDISDWQVVFFDATSWPLPRTIFTVPAASVCTPGRVVRLREGNSTSSFPMFYIGPGIAWAGAGPEDPIAIVVLDRNGSIVDAVFAGSARPEDVFDPAELKGYWLGSLIGPLSPSQSFHRVGAFNNRGNDDWVTGPSSIGSRHPNLQLPFSDNAHIAISPTFVAGFADGVWTGDLTVLGVSSDLVFRADDGNQHFGFSAPINLIVDSDLALIPKLLPEVIDIESATTMHVVVTNRGSSQLTGIVLTNSLAGAVRIVSARADQGECEVTLNSVRCSLGTLPGGAGVTVELTFVASEPGSIQYTGAAVARETDPVSSNNVLGFALGVQGPCSSVARDAVAWWPSNGMAFDAVRGIFPELRGGVSYSRGKSGDAFYFDGKDDRILVPDSAPLNFGAGEDFSIEAWVQVASRSKAEMIIVDKRIVDSSNAAVGYNFWIANGRLACQMADAPARATGFSTFYATHADARDGKLHHVAMTVSRTNQNGGRFFFDGALAGTFDPTLRPGDLGNPGPFRIGNHATPVGNALFAGTIDELAVYRRVLTVDEVRAVFLAGTHGKCHDTDHDTDGLPDLWEAQNGFNGDDAEDASRDSDGDGHTNLHEFLTGSNPIRGDDVLRLTANQEEGSAVRLRFPSVLGRRYVIEWRASHSDEPWQVLGAEFQGTGGVLELADTRSETRTSFYRVRLVW